MKSTPTTALPTAEESSSTAELGVDEEQGASGAHAKASNSKHSWMSATHIGMVEVHFTICFA